MHARMIHSLNGKQSPIPYGKKGQVKLFPKKLGWVMQYLFPLHSISQQTTVCLICTRVHKDFTEQLRLCIKIKKKIILCESLSSFTYVSGVFSLNREVC